MSYKAAQRAACLPWPEAGKAGPTRHAVYNVIAGHADSEINRCFLSMPTIAAEAWGIDERTARRAVRALESHVDIRIVTLGSGRGNATVYEFVPTWSTPAGKGDTRAPLYRSKNGAAKGGHQCSKRGHQRQKGGHPRPQQDHEQYQEHPTRPPRPQARAAAASSQQSQRSRLMPRKAARAHPDGLAPGARQPAVQRMSMRLGRGRARRPVRNVEAAALLVELGRLHDLEFSGDVVERVLAEAVPLAALQAGGNSTSALQAVLWVATEMFDSGASALYVCAHLRSFGG